MEWKVVVDPDEPPVIWQCAKCEALLGEPHAPGCHCTLVEGVPVDEYLDSQREL